MVFLPDFLDDVQPQDGSLFNNMFYLKVQRGPPYPPGPGPVNRPVQVIELSATLGEELPYIVTWSFGMFFFVDFGEHSDENSGEKAPTYTV